jgi:hypothetical protein
MALATTDNPIEFTVTCDVLVCTGSHTHAVAGVVKVSVCATHGCQSRRIPQCPRNDYCVPRRPVAKSTPSRLPAYARDTAKQRIDSVSLFVFRPKRNGKLVAFMLEVV